ncbi:MAG: hypothetical protein JO166_07805 [Deltaproteobacteria bacterium]|nr:hypothetical protein [Deltaproteobacteria bacterium]
MVPQDPAENGNGTPEWKPPLPEKIPDATYAPAMLAMGITFLLFGMVTLYVFSLAGVILMVWSLGKWVGELVRGK